MPEIADFPDSIYSCSSKEMSFFGNLLDHPYKNDPRFKITRVTMEPRPQGLQIIQEELGEFFYEINGLLIKYTLYDQMMSAIDQWGWLHTDKNISYRIKSGIVVEIRIDGNFMNSFSNIKKTDIINKFGKFDKEFIKYNKFDNTISVSIYIYKERSLRIYYDNCDNVIMNINLGETLLEYD